MATKFQNLKVLILKINATKQENGLIKKLFLVLNMKLQLNVNNRYYVFQKKQPSRVAFFVRILYNSIIFNILRVAFIAADVWSKSKPRVLNERVPSFQVMTVSTNASVFPPGGIVTT